MIFSIFDQAGQGRLQIQISGGLAFLSVFNETNQQIFELKPKRDELDWMAKAILLALQNIKQEGGVMVYMDRRYWTQSGADCYHSNAACGTCPIFLSYGLSKDHPDSTMRCSQPQSNQYLIDKGVMPPVEFGKAERLVTAFVGDRKAVFS